MYGLRRVCYWVATPSLIIPRSVQQNHILMPHISTSLIHSRHVNKTSSTGPCCCAFRLMLILFCVLRELRAFCTLLGLNDIEVPAALREIPKTNGGESHCKREHGPSKTATVVSETQRMMKRVAPTPSNSWSCQPFAQLALQQMPQSPLHFSLSSGRG